MSKTIPSNFRQNWDKEASEQKIKYLDDANQSPAVQTYKTMAHTLLAINAGDKILDVGCGTGYDAIQLAQLVKAKNKNNGKNYKGEVVGVDIDGGLVKHATEQAKELALPVTFYKVDVYNLKSLFEANQFNGCLSERMLQHLEYPQKAIAEMVSVLSSGGRLVITEPDWDSVVVNVPVKRSLIRQITNYWADTRKHGWIGRQLPALFDACGLINVSIHPISMSGVVRKYNWDIDPIALIKSAEEATKVGLITTTDLDTWLTALKEAEGNNSFFAHTTGFTVCGQKP